jgi:hypothetical protein
LKYRKSHFSAKNSHMPWKCSHHLLSHKIPHNDPDTVQYNLRHWSPVPCWQCKILGYLIDENVYFLLNFSFFSKMGILIDISIFIRNYVYKCKTNFNNRKLKSNFTLSVSTFIIQLFRIMLLRICAANKGIGLWAHDKSESTQGRGEDR